MKKCWLSMLMVSTVLMTTVMGCSNGKTTNNEANTSAVSSDAKINETEAGTAEQAGEADHLAGTVDIFEFKVEIADALKAATESYMAIHPNVKINLEIVGGGDDYGAALRTKMQNSDQPEIYNIGGPQDIVDWKESLEDLSSESWIPNTVDGLLDDVTDEGVIYGMPMAIEGYGFIYNKAIFEAAGIDIESMKTFVEIDTAFSDLQAMIDAGSLMDQFPVLEAVVEYPVKEKWVTGMHTANIALGQEFANCTEAFQAQEIAFTYAPELKELIDLQIKYTSNASNPAALNAVDYSMQIGGGLAIERVAVVQQGNWIYPEVKNIDPVIADNLGIIWLPLKGVSEGNTPVGVPMYWAVNSNSSEADRACAKDFLNWLYQSEEGKSIVVNDFSFIPPFTNYGDLKPADPIGAKISEAATAGTIAPWVFNGCPTSWAENVLGSEIQSYVGGEKTWDEVIATVKLKWSEAR